MNVDKIVSSKFECLEMNFSFVAERATNMDNREKLLNPVYKSLVASRPELFT